ncbi:hypothetical protein GCM10010429_43460 [Micromonospora olivasterospora]
MLTQTPPYHLTAEPKRRFTLVQWLSGTDPAMRGTARDARPTPRAPGRPPTGLRQHDLAHLRADGYGVWLEDGRCLRFLVHVDSGPVGDAVAEREKRSSGLGGLLAGYRRTDRAVPVGAVLVIAQDAEREEQMLADLGREPLRARIAVTRREMLYRHWPNDQVWRLPEDSNARRLTDLGS